RVRDFAGYADGMRHKQARPAKCMLVFQALLVTERRVQRRRYICWPATASSATRSCSGNSFPLFSARRSIPAHAFWLKKNRCGIGAASKVCDNDDTAASLGHSPVLSVADTPRGASLRSRDQTRTAPLSPCWWLDGGISAHKST